MSILSAFVPVSLKTAVVTHILKRTNLDPTDYNNYRPMSEKSWKRLSPLKCSHLYLSTIVLIYFSLVSPKPQYWNCISKGYQPFTLWWLWKPSLLLLLDLSSAFDNVCHKVLLMRLLETGISGAVLCWFSSAHITAHITWILFKLRWLAVSSRITYKILLL